MGIRRWIHRKMWGAGRTVRYIFIHPTCGQADVEAGYLPSGWPEVFLRGAAWRLKRRRSACNGKAISRPVPAAGRPPPLTADC